MAGLLSPARIGVTLTNLGPMLNGFPGVGIGNTADNIDVSGATGTGYLTSGTPATGPLTNPLVTYLPGTTSAGGIIIGGGVSGRDASLSLIGDSSPDLVFSGQIATTLTISDGAKIGAKSTPINLGSTAEVTITLPSGFGASPAAGSIIPDINGDHLPDFCVGSNNQAGSVLVYW